LRPQADRDDSVVDAFSKVNRSLFWALQAALTAVD
jgi:hypothetical protein